MTETPLETPLESPAEDAAEQRQDAYPGGPRPDPTDATSLEADPTDAREQAAEVPLDEDAWP
jgi:hypothetical protein